MYYTDIKVLGYGGNISGYTDDDGVGHYIVMFYSDHEKICYYIGNMLQIINSSDYSIDWNKLLLKLYPQHKYYPVNSGQVLFPQFNTIEEVKLFVLALNTRLRIIVR